MSIAAQRYYLDGYDLYLYFGVGVEKGSDDLLKFPDRKDSTTHNWLDENGLDVDLTRVFLESREATFQMWLLANDETDFWNKYNLFQSYLAKPGVRRLTITELSRDFFVYYKKTTALSRLTRIKDSNQVGLKFTITFIEQDPTSSREEIFLVREDGAFIIT